MVFAEGYRKDAGLRTLCGCLFKCFFLTFYRTGVRRLLPAGVRRLLPVRRQRTLCGIRIKSFGTRFVYAPLCGDSDLCDPDRNKRDVEFVDEAGREAKGEVVEL